MGDIGRGILKGALNQVAALFGAVSGTFYGWGSWCVGKMVLETMVDYLYDLGYFFGEVSWNFIILRDSLLRIYDQAQEILNWDTIWSLVQEAVPDLSVIADWIANAFNYVTGLINIHWEWASGEIHDWIDEALQNLDAVWELIKGKVEALIAQVAWVIGQAIIALQTGLANIESAWTDFSTVVLPTLLSAIQIDDLIRSWLKSYEPFWAGWQEIKDEVVEFFTDPEDWLYKAADRIIERFW